MPTSARLSVTWRNSLRGEGSFEFLVQEAWRSPVRFSPSFTPVTPDRKPKTQNLKLSHARHRSLRPHQSVSDVQETTGLRRRGEGPVPAEIRADGRGEGREVHDRAGGVGRLSGTQRRGQDDYAQDAG